MASHASTVRWLAERVAVLLGVPADTVSASVPFSALGLSSVQAVQLSDELQRWAAVELAPTVAYDHPTITDLAGLIAQLTDGERPGGERARAEPGTATRAVSGPGQPPSGVPVAIVGIGCRMPGARGLAEFWQLLSDGADAIGDVPAARWPEGAFPQQRQGGFLDDLEGFDADFFGISVREASRMDPQQRLALEVSWEALEDAGIAADGLAGSATGVFMGVSTFDHGTALFGSLEGVQPYDGTGAALSIVANRLSYCLNLRGPSMTVDTACSSSLVAVHLACQALRAGEADLAIAGGVNVITSPRIALSFSASSLLAPDSRCKPFDHRANGYVRSEGVGVVVLKPLPRAIADGDRVYAVLLGSSVNQDGRTNGITAPHGAAQAEVLRAACAAAGVSPAELGYVEAHGTGTAVGDPIEIAAVAQVYGAGRPAGRPLLVGSVKSNIGHLEAAAGVAGLIKTALALHHQLIPPTLHYERPNPLLGLDQIPVVVAARPSAWPAAPGGAPAPAGVSSFGFGGTNAHLIVGAAPARPEDSEAGAGRLPRLVTISARSDSALRDRAAAWAAEARARAGDAGWLSRAAVSAARRVDHAPHRAAVVASDAIELADALREIAAGRPGDDRAGMSREAHRAPKVALVFPGQGPQWPGMGRQLAASLPVFREAMREADAAIASHLGRSLWSDEHGLVVAGTAEVQPALFATQVALAAVWRDWGVWGDGVVGHSMGEIAAACVAGALSLDDAAQLVCERSRLLTELTGLGGLALVELEEDESAALISARGHRLSVAAVNGPRATVLSGDPGALGELLGELDARGIFWRKIAVDFAAHSPQVEPLLPRLRSALDQIAPMAADRPMYSTVTAAPVAGTDLGPDYWLRNVRAPVRFGPAIGRMGSDGFDAFIEIAPHPVLARPIAEYLAEAGRAGVPVISSLRRGEDELGSLLGALGQLHTAGGSIDWRAVYPGPSRHQPLPPHGWRHEQFPIARPAAPSPDRAEPAGGRLLGRSMSVGAVPGLRVWELPLSLDSRPELADHQVEGTAVVPAAYWLTAALEAASAQARGAAVALREVSFAQPCALDGDRSPELQLSLRSEAGRRTRFAVTGSPAAGQPRSHAEGLVVELPAEAAAPAPQNADLIARRCASEFSADDLYQRLDRAGLNYGPAFRGLAGGYLGEGEALARVRLPAALPGGYGPLHPALLDSCLHTIAAAASESVTEAAVPLPIGAAEVRSAAAPPLTEGWCHARVRPAGDRDLIADVVVFDDSGAVAWSADGFLVRLSALRRGPGQGRLHEVRWRPLAPGPPAGGPAGWLLLAHDDEVARVLADALTRAGDRVLTADPADLAAGRYAALLAAAETTLDGSLRGVVDLRAAGAGPGRPADLLAASTRAALLLAQAVTGRSWRQPPPRLWLATAGIEVAGGAAPGALAAAGLWGLGRTVANEFPASGCSVVDLDPAAAGLGLDVAAAALRAQRPPRQAAVRDGQLLTPVLAELPRAPRLTGLPGLRADRAYLVTGGLGALGLQVAAWLAGRGARQLLLLGRGTPSAAAASQIAALTAAGCAVQLVRADAADRPGLAAALRGTGWSGRIGGVVHLAGELRDALVPDLDATALDGVLGGKALGAWHLHELTRDEPAEFFILFSSLAGVFGSPGQAGYAAANTFLDALARHRAVLGLPGQSLAWGPWRGPGLAAASGGADRLAARGVPPLDPAAAIGLLGEAVSDGRPHLVISAFDPAEIRRAGSWAVARDLLAPALGEDSGPDRPARARGWLAEDLAAADLDAERRHALGVFLSEQVALGLGTQPGAVPAGVPLQALGFDSLMAIELRGRLEEALGIRLSATLAYAHPTVDALADHLMARLWPAGPGPGPAAEPARPGGVTHDDLTALDDAELAALLAAELEAPGRSRQEDE